MPSGNSIDLTGKRFGKLTVIRLYQNINYKRFWLCQCDCGNETVVYVSKLTKDRIDNDGNYEIGNVRWATIEQQNNNKRNIRKKVIEC